MTVPSSLDLDSLSGSSNSKRLIKLIFSYDKINTNLLYAKVTSMYNEFNYIIKILNKSNDLKYIKFMKAALLNELNKRIYDKSFLQVIKNENVRAEIKQRLKSLIKYKISNDIIT